MNFKVIAVYVTWIVYCFLMHKTFGGFGLFSGCIEGCVGLGLASIFWTTEVEHRGKK